MIPSNSRRNGKRHPSATANAAATLPPSQPAFTPSIVELNRRMRFNPLRMVSPENLAAAHDHFDLGYLWQGALFWDAMIRRDDTLSFVVPQLQNAVAQKPWGVQKRKDADPVEAARHAAALQYFYDNVTAVDAFDKNIRGDRHLLLKQMGLAHAMRYAVHHFVWKPSGKMIAVEGGAPVPALTAEMEYVPLWFFENTSGTLRLLRHGGYGGIGEDLDWEGEWMVTSGEGAMFAAAGCYIFKRLTFQDWTIYNERYGQQKVIGMTTARADSDAGRALTSIVQDFNGDMGIALHECASTDKPPISLLGPEGTASVEVFERFLDRQDEKMTVMFRGGGQANIASKDNEHGITAQMNETEALEIAHCANIASACRTFIDRAVIRYCFGEGVEPLAWFGLPDMDDEDAAQLRENAGFIADRGGRVDLGNVADRLGVPLLDESAPDEEVLQSLTPKTDPNAEDPVLKRQIEYDQYKRKESAASKTANSAQLSRLQELVEEALRTANTGEDGHWVTIEHHPVFIKRGDKRPISEIEAEWHGHAAAAGHTGQGDKAAYARLGAAQAAEKAHSAKMRHMLETEGKNFFHPDVQAALPESNRVSQERADAENADFGSIKTHTMTLEAFKAQKWEKRGTHLISENGHRISVGDMGGHIRAIEEEHYRRTSAAHAEVRKGRGAIEAAIAGHDVSEAMQTQDFGPVSFVNVKTGTEAKGFHDGGGIQHLVAARNAEGKDGAAIARMMPEVIAFGKHGNVVGPANGQRVNITHNGYTAALSLHHFGQRKTWLLTGMDYEKP